MNSILNFFSYLVIFLPVALVTGPFISDLIVSTSAIFFIFYSIKNNNYIYFNNLFFKLFIVFWICIIVSASFSNEILVSLKSAVPYVRFPIFVVFVLFLVHETKDFLRKLMLEIQLS